MRKKEYDSPQMEILDVKLEHSFCGSIVNRDEEAEPTIDINAHEVGGNGTWD